MPVLSDLSCRFSQSRRPGILATRSSSSGTQQGCSSSCAATTATAATAAAAATTATLMALHPAHLVNASSCAVPAGHRSPVGWRQQQQELQQQCPHSLAGGSSDTSSSNDGSAAAAAAVGPAALLRPSRSCTGTVGKQAVPRTAWSSWAQGLCVLCELL
jgi:hypothetical protein